LVRSFTRKYLIFVQLDNISDATLVKRCRELNRAGAMFVLILFF